MHAGHLHRRTFVLTALRFRVQRPDRGEETAERVQRIGDLLLHPAVSARAAQRNAETARANRMVDDRFITRTVDRDRGAGRHP